MKKHGLAIALAAALVQPLASQTAAAEGWEATLTPYLWVMGLDGEIKYGPHELDTSTDFGDIVDNTDVAGSAILELANGRWVSYFQGDYLSLDSGDVSTRVPGADADLEVTNTLLSAATGYRVPTGEKSHIDVMVGLRYANIETEADIQGVGRRDGDHTIYDGILMLRPRFAIGSGSSWYFSPTASIGTGDSDLTWELAPQFVYDNCGTEIRVGYRSLNYKFEEGSREFDLETSGPIIGVGFTF